MTAWELCAEIDAKLAPLREDIERARMRHEPDWWLRAIAPHNTYAADELKRREK